jgi:hypothetical protein
LSSFQRRKKLSIIWHTVISLGILYAWWVLVLGFRRVVRTTLKTAWAWSIVAAAAWSITWIADHVTHVISDAIADHAWYGCAVLSLCPAIAVLGSRRPGTRVWGWFILFPMLLTLSWPIIAGGWQGTELRRLQLEGPQLAAFCLVLVMGYGNYCGTRFTPTALMLAGSLLAIVVSSFVDARNSGVDRSTVRSWCTALSVFSIIVIRFSRRPPAATRFDQLWFDFFDAFGIVWGRRVQDRVNFFLKSEEIRVQLQLDGFHWPDELKSDLEISMKDAKPELTALNSAEARVEHILRWLLRRFVDPLWIEQRLGSISKTEIRISIVDS